MRKGHILLIGGDPDVNRTLTVYLDSHQFSTQVVSRGDEALSASRQSPPDAVILDMDLPDVNGHALCQQMRADEPAGKRFILALLPASDRDAKLDALEAGADEVLIHPINMEEIRLRIEGRLGLCSS